MNQAACELINSQGASQVTPIACEWRFSDNHLKRPSANGLYYDWRSLPLAWQPIFGTIDTPYHFLVLPFRRLSVTPKSHYGKFLSCLGGKAIRTLSLSRPI
jgi:hypothetical protein